MKKSVIEIFEFDYYGIILVLRNGDDFVIGKEVAINIE